MAKIAFNKLKCKLNENIEIVEFANEKIEVRQYLPVQDKLALIARVIMQAHEQDENYSNPVKILVFTHLEIIFAYTNISFTEKHKEDLPKLYDSLASSGALTAIMAAIPEEEKEMLFTGIESTVKSVYDYQNSALGIMENLKGTFNAQDFDTTQLLNSVQQLQENSTLSEIIPLLGLE